MLHLYMDLDDTLIQTQQLFEKYKRACTSFILIAAEGDHLTMNDVLTYFNAREVENIDRYGFENRRFSISWMETYRHFIPEGTEEDVVGRLAGCVFDSVAPLKEGALDTLNTLTELGYQIHLITVGVDACQRKRLTDVGITHYFSDISVVPYKDRSILASIITDTENSVMIGNSVRSDINPSIELGIPAIHVEAPNWFHDDMPLLEGGTVFYGDIADVPTLISQLESYRVAEPVGV